MKIELAGKTALVTGASQGIGRSIALALAERGVAVFGGSRQPDEVEWPAGVRPCLFEMDTPSAVERSWARSPFADTGVSILINNAGAGVVGPFAGAAFSEWQSQIELMLLAPMRLAQLALVRWTAENCGVLVNVGSLATEFPIPFMSGYNAAKSGIAAFTESLALEADPRSVRLIELRLGDFNTGFGSRMRRLTGDGRCAAAIAAMDRNMASAPAPERAARTLLKALENDRSGVVRAGGFFQRVVASAFGRLASPSRRRAANLRYYNVRR